MKNSTVVVLGGAGLVGAWISKIFMSHKYDVRLVDNNITGTEGCLLDLTKPIGGVGHIFDGAVAVVFALPEAVAAQAVSWIIDYISSDILIISTCSVQESFYNKLKVLSVH